jgi:dolichol-phosphate mannosyltransferase
MDGDLQDPHEAVPTLLEQYQQGYDVVYVRRVNRKESRWLRSCYWVFYRLLAVLSSTKLPLDADDFGLMSRRVIDEIRRMPEHHRYLRGMRTWVGFRQIGVTIERSARHVGITNAFSIVPLRAAAAVGAVAMLISIAYSLYAVYAKFWRGTPKDSRR